MNFKEYIEETKASPMNLLGNINISKNLKFHIDNQISLCENIFRIYSEAYFNLINEVRELYNDNLIELNDDDFELIESDIGKTAIYEGKEVYLDAPIIEEEILEEAEHKGKKVRLNKPFRTPGENKKFAVYVKTPSGRVKKVRFGDPNLSIKNSSKSRAKSFRARHKCSEKKDKTKAGYWSCNIARFGKSVGLTSNRPW